MKTVKYLGIFAILLWQTGLIQAQLQDFIEFGVPDKTRAIPVSECPEGQVFFEEDGRCYESGTQGPGSPCGAKAMLTNSPIDLTKGICYCQKDHSGRAMIYHRALKKCFPIFSQGPCGKSQWLSVRNYVGICEANPCSKISNGSGRDDIVPFQGKCVSLRDESKYCEGDKEFKFSYDGTSLECTHRQSFSPAFASPGVVAPLDCPEGTFRNIDNSCEPLAQYV